MAKKENGESTPAPPSLKKQSSSVGSSKNGSILSFFSKTANATPNASSGVWKPQSEAKGVNALAKHPVPVKKPAFRKPAGKNITPVPSSDAVGPSSSQEKENGIPEEVEDIGILSPLSPAKRSIQEITNLVAFGSSPSRKVSYPSRVFSVIIKSML